MYPKFASNDAQNLKHVPHSGLCYHIGEPNLCRTVCYHCDKVTFVQ